MNGLKPPVVILPMEGHVYHGGMIDASGTLPAHARYSEWSCCDIEWQRAVVVTRENNEYVAAHTPPGQIKESVFPSLRSPWHTAIGLNGHAPHQEQAPTFRSGWSFDALRPHSHKFGYQYWFRIRENYLPGHASGPWSAWRSFIVQEPIGSKVRYRGMRVLPAGNPKPVMRSLPGHKPNARKGPLNLPHRTSVGH